MCTAYRSPPGIPMSTILIDDEGVEVMSIGDLVFKCMTLGNEVEILRRKFELKEGS